MPKPDLIHVIFNGGQSEESQGMVSLRKKTWLFYVWGKFSGHHANGKAGVETIGIGEEDFKNLTHDGDDHRKRAKWDHVVELLTCPAFHLDDQLQAATVTEDEADADPLLTADQKHKYLAHRGNACPFCSSQEIEGTGQSNSDADWQENEVECKSCGAIWLDLYTISGVQGVSGPVEMIKPGIVVEVAEANRAKGACVGKPWEAWKENGRWRMAGHGWYPTGEIDAVIAAVRAALQKKKRA